MGATTKSFESYENIIAPKTSTTMTKVVLINPKYEFISDMYFPSSSETAVPEGDTY